MILLVLPSCRRVMLLCLVSILFERINRWLLLMVRSECCLCCRITTSQHGSRCPRRDYLLFHKLFTYIHYLGLFIPLICTWKCFFVSGMHKESFVMCLTTNCSTLKVETSMKAISLCRTTAGLVMMEKGPFCSVLSGATSLKEFTSTIIMVGAVSSWESHFCLVNYNY